MKDDDIDIYRLISESIALELHISELYSLFSSIFPDHSIFWQTLSQEEKNHASLIKSGEKVLLEKGLFPLDVISKNLDSLVKMNSVVTRILKYCKESRPSIEYAVSYAVLIEESAGEKNFQNAFEDKPESFGFALFSELNKNCKDHASRIRNYAEKKNIRIYSAILRSLDLPI